MPRWLVLIIVLLSGSLTGAGLLSASMDDSATECEQLGEDDIDVCGVFLQYWERHGGADVFGEPLTGQIRELDQVTGEPRDVQYFEYARLEHHPDLDDTPYEIQAGRLGAELLDVDGVARADLPEADSEDTFYFGATGQAVAPAFQEFWSENGIDLGEDAAPFGGSIARFGYPLMPAGEVEDENGTRLAQWFERTRLEIDDQGSVTVAPAGVLVSDDQDGLSLRVQREIEGVLASVYESHESPGLGAWLDSPDLGSWSWSHGHANPDAEAAYDLDTHHRIGSVTKPIIGNLVLQLVDDGLLELDDTVDQWFPDLDGAEDVTIRMLGTMTSGIFNYTEVMAWSSEMLDDPARVWEPDELLEFAFVMTETVEPDGEWSYSNTNYVMLGLIIEDVTGNDLADELAARIFEPLNLTDTTFPVSSDATLPEPYAHAESVMGLGSSARDSTGWNPSWAWAAGQIVSTPADMLAWSPEMYRSELLCDEMSEARRELVDILPEEALEDASGSNDAGYGFGVLYDQGWYGHDGLISGYTTMVAHNPDLDVSLVIMSNSDAISDEHTLATGRAYDEIKQILAREYGEQEAQE